MIIINALETVDQQFLLFVNGHHTPWLDMVMWHFTQTYVWIPMYVIMTYLLFVYKGRAAWRWLLLIVLTVAMADVISSGIIKPLVARPRPTHTPGLAEYLHLHQFSNGTFYRGGAYGFLSSHAANSTAIAFLFWLLVRKDVVRPRLLSSLLVLYVVLFCYTRMYLAVHYPSDILGGILIGGFMATLSYYLSSKFYYLCGRF